MKIELEGWAPFDVAETDGRAFANHLLSVLHGQDIHWKGNVGGRAALLHHPRRGWFLLVDNGGELTVDRLNDPQPATDIPFTDGHELIDPGTLAYRIKAAMENRPIDWTFRCPELASC